MQKLQANFKAINARNDNEGEKSKKGKKGQKVMDSDEEMEAYKDLIAGSSDEQSESGSDAEENQEKEQKRIEEMRRKLLGGLDTIGGANDNYRRNKTLQGQGSDFPEDSDEAQALQVKFGVGFGEDIGEKLLT